MPAVLSSITGNGTVPTGGTTGQQLTKNSNTNYDVGWAAAGSGGSGSPGGSDTYVQYNNAGAFGGDAGLTYLKASTTQAILGLGATGGTLWWFGTGGSVGNAGYWTGSQLGIYNGSTTNIPFMIDSNNVYLCSSGIFGWQSAGRGGTLDTGLYRNASGTVEINNGTAGTYRDLTLRNLTVSGTSSIQVTPGSSADLQFRSTSANSTYVRCIPNGAQTTNPAVLQLFGTDFVADSTNYEYLSINTKGSSDTYHRIFSNAAGTGTRRPLSINADATTTQLVFSTTGPITVGGTDVGFARNTSGVLEINSGTAGTYRDIIARTHNATSGYQINGVTTAGDYINSNINNITPAAVDLSLAASVITVPAGGFVSKGQYRCLFDVVKSAGTGTIVITLRVGTAGTTGDASIMTFTCPAAGTSVADTGVFEVIANWRSVGTGTSAVMSGYCRAQKNTITAAGLWSTTSAALTIIGSPSPSSGFDSSAATKISVSFNGSTAFAGTMTTIQATLAQ